MSIEIDLYNEIDQIYLAENWEVPPPDYKNQKSNPTLELFYNLMTNRKKIAKDYLNEKKQV